MSENSPSAEEALPRPRTGQSSDKKVAEGHVRDQAAWREYELLVDLYKFYLGLVVQAAGGYFIIVGGILTLVLANVDNQPIVAVALVVPILLSLLGVIAGWVAKPKVEELSFAVRQLGDRFNVTLRPHIEILKWAATGSIGLLSVAAAFLAILLAKLV